MRGRKRTCFTTVGHKRSSSRSMIPSVGIGVSREGGGVCSGRLSICFLRESALRGGQKRIMETYCSLREVEEASGEGREEREVDGGACQSSWRRKQG